MYSNTRLGDILKGLPRHQVDRLARQHRADHYAKRFDAWSHLVSMVSAQLLGSQSLRDLESCYNAAGSTHYHLGTQALRRSTLADANRTRDAGFFKAVCELLLQGARRQVRRDLQAPLYLIDSSPIPLSGRGFDDWTLDNRIQRTQGLKLHLHYACNTQAPVDVQLTPPNVNDVEVGKQLSPEAGATYVFDKGYCDYNWWHALNEQGACFVSRFKRNANLTDVQPWQPEAPRSEVILSDEQVYLKNRVLGARKRPNLYRKPLRRIRVRREGKTPLVLVTNDFERSADDIAALYKQRWEIELFFKWIKQNLKIKRFLGRSENAVKIQLYTAIIAYLLIQAYRTTQGMTESMQRVLNIIARSLFDRPRTAYAMAKARRLERERYAALQPPLPLATDFPGQ